MKQNHTEQLHKITQPLLEWYRENARDLPWRHTDDPYKIWVSEIMLQQTRVAAVLGYYDRFLNVFPTVYDLATASEEQLLKQWEGLGYYSRVRNMQKAAKQVVEQYNGCFPPSFDALMGLSGIGEYTAGAIASAAFGIKVPAVDGNVLRVLSRITESYDDIADPKVKKVFCALTESMLPNTAEEMRIFNQAMMELGATVCVPNGAPKCDICPVMEFCKACMNDTAVMLPVKSGKKPRRIEERTVFVLFSDDKVALCKRSSEGLLAGLWEFPNVVGFLDESETYDRLQESGTTVIDWKKQLNAKHVFTHVEWHMKGYVLEVNHSDKDGYVWVGETEFEQYAIPSAFSRFTDTVKEYWNKKNT